MGKLAEPMWAKSFFYAVRPWLRSFRGFFLYNRLPYDRTIWSKMRDPWYYIVTLTAGVSTAGAARLRHGQRQKHEFVSAWLSAPPALRLPTP